MNTNKNQKRSPSSILNALFLGQDYFQKVYELAKYIGEDQRSLDAAEIIFQMVLRRGQYITRQKLAEYLCMDRQKINKSISLLSDMGVITSHKKGYLWRGYAPLVKGMNVDEATDVFNLIHCFDYEGGLERIWEVMTLIHTIQNMLGIGISPCSRRHFVICMCMGQPFECSKKTKRRLVKELFSTDLKEIGEEFSFDDYKKDTEDIQEWRTFRNRCLGEYQKAKLLLLRPEWWSKRLPYYIPQISCDVATQAKNLFPRNVEEDPRETLNKRNIYIYEYLVHQPCTDDYDFSPFSPFYGLPLEKRLELLPKTIGHTELYEFPGLKQEQWIGAFNYDEPDLDRRRNLLKGTSLYPKKYGT